MGSCPSTPEPCCYQQTSVVVQETGAASWHLPSLWMAGGLSVTRACVVDKYDSEIGVIWGEEAPFPPSEFCSHQSTLPPSLLASLLLTDKGKLTVGGEAGLASLLTLASPEKSGGWGF